MRAITLKIVKSWGEKRTDLAKRVSAIITNMIKNDSPYGKANFSKDEMKRIDEIYKSLKNENNIDLYIEFIEMLKADDMTIETYHTNCM